MLPPALVHHGQQDAALQGAHGLLTELDVGQGIGLDTRLGVLVGHGDVLAELLDEALRGQYVLAAQRLDDLVLGQAHRVEAAELAPQSVQVPLVGAALGRAGLNDGGDGLGPEGLDLRLEVLTVQDAATLGVDLLALLGHDVVVLEDVSCGSRSCATPPDAGPRRCRG